MPDAHLRTGITSLLILLLPPPLPENIGAQSSAAAGGVDRDNEVIRNRVT